MATKRKPQMFERRKRDPVLHALSVRMASFEQRAANAEEGLRVVGRSVGQLSLEVAENTTITTEVRDGTRDLVAFAKDVEVVWAICKRIRQQTFIFAKWIAVVAGAFTATVAAIHVIGEIDVLEWLRAWWRAWWTR